MAKSEPDKKWKIDKGTLTNGFIEMNNGVPGQPPTRTQLNSFDLSMLGTDGSGIQAHEAVATVLQSLLEKGGLAQNPQSKNLEIPQTAQPMLNLLQQGLKKR